MGARCHVFRTASLLVAAALLASCGGEDPGPPRIVASTARVPFHLSTCNRVNRIPEDKLVEFEDRDGALEAGHEPCMMCRP